MTTEIKIELSDAEIITAREALQALSQSAKKDRDHYLAFGTVWLSVRQQSNKNTKLMGEYRKTVFNNMIDAQTAAYAARMAELWDKKWDDDFESLKDWTEKHRPNLNNPRPLVQDYLKAHTAFIDRKTADKQKETMRLVNEERAKKRASMTPEQQKAYDKRIREENLKALAEAKAQNLKEYEDRAAAMRKRMGIKDNEPIIVTKKTSAIVCTKLAVAINEVIQGINDNIIEDKQVKEIELHLQNLNRAIKQRMAKATTPAKKVSTKKSKKKAA